MTESVKMVSFFALHVACRKHCLTYKSWGIQLLIYVVGVTRHEAQQWCLAHAFELVELNPQELPDEDGEFLKWEK